VAVASQPAHQGWAAARTSCEKVIAGTEKESRVTDFVFTLVTIVFFLVAIGYLRGCERLK
jgi:succinate-acetate transporter protein